MKLSESFDGSYIVTGTVTPPLMHNYVSNLNNLYNYLCTEICRLKGYFCYHSFGMIRYPVRHKSNDATSAVIKLCK